MISNHTFDDQLEKRVLPHRWSMIFSVLSLVLVNLISASVHSFAQEIDLDQRKLMTQQELAGLKQQITLSEEKKKQLEKEIASLELDRATINRNLIDTSARTRKLDEGIERASTRLEELRVGEQQAHQSLHAKRNVLIEVIAALQRMGHKPPPALLVTPEDALSSVRSAILLGAVVPKIREETDLLADELNNLVQIRNDIDNNRRALSADLAKLAEEEVRLTLLLEEKKELSKTARLELSRQTALAGELAGKASSLSGLISKLETEIEAVKQAQFEAEQAEEKRLANLTPKTNVPDFSDTARLAPAMAFIDAKGLLPKPVGGVELIQFGQKMKTGEFSKGVTIATRAGSRVNTPTDGWVIYSGPFRSYGPLLILSAGNGYHVVLAGMEKIEVELGQFVLAGEPVGIMGERRIASLGEVDIGFLRPALYVEFRKDGKSIDPSPWWSKTNLEESNG